MGKVRVAGFGVSIDGFGAGPDQGLEHPLGKRGGELMNWFYPTRAFRSMIGKDGGTEDHFAGAAMEGFGAFILGRNMFGPAGDDWGGPGWKGWWGDNPPYHAPTFSRHPVGQQFGNEFVRRHRHHDASPLLPGFFLECPPERLHAARAAGR